MNFKGIFGGSTDRFGISIDVLKSLYQKAIRRGLKTEAIFAALRLYEFTFQGGFPDLMNAAPTTSPVKWGGTAIRSNLLNRIPVIFGEDCGIGAMGMLQTVGQFLKYLEENPAFGQGAGIHQLIQLTAVMVDSPKSRLVSYAKAVFIEAYDDPLKRVVALRYIPELQDWVGEVDAAVATDFERFIYVYQRREEVKSEYFKFLCVRYALKMKYSETKMKILRGWPKQRNIESPIVFQLWNYFLTTKDPNIEVLYQWYLNYPNENMIFLVLAVFYLILPRTDINMESITLNLGERSVDEWFAAAQTENITMPDFAVDKHTKAGREAGKTGRDFATEGALVTNQWRYHPQVFQDIYIAIRTITPDEVTGLTAITNQMAALLMTPITTAADIAAAPVKRQRKPKAGAVTLTPTIQVPKEWVEMLMSPTTPRGQIRCATWKLFTYLPLQFPQYVFKGPWIADGNNPMKLAIITARSRGFELLGSRAVHIDLALDYLNRYWLIMPNLSRIPPEQWKLEPKVDTISGDNIVIIDRASLGVPQMSAYPPDQQAWIMFGPLFLFKTFIDAALLGAGDQGNHNALVYTNDRDELRCLIIDYEDSTTRKAMTEPTGVFAKSNKAYRAMYEQNRGARGHELRDYVMTELPQRLPELQQIFANTTVNLAGNLAMLQSVKWD